MKSGDVLNQIKKAHMRERVQNIRWFAIDRKYSIHRGGFYLPGSDCILMTLLQQHKIYRPNYVCT